MAPAARAARELRMAAVAMVAGEGERERSPPGVQGRAAAWAAAWAAALEASVRGVDQERVGRAAGLREAP